MTPQMPPVVQAVFDKVGHDARTGMLGLRTLIDATAEKLPGIGAVDEVLRWRQPAYLTPFGSGSSLRLGATKAGGFALYVHCRTSLIADFRALTNGVCTTQGSRAVLFGAQKAINPDVVSIAIFRALTWHWRADPRRALQKASGLGTNAL